MTFGRSYNGKSRDLSVKGKQGEGGLRGGPFDF